MNTSTNDAVMSPTLKNFRYTFAIALLCLTLIAGVSESWCQVPYTTVQYAVRVERDVEFGVSVDFAGRNARLSVDIYKPVADKNCRRPIIVLVHGGAWVKGTSTDNSIVALANNFAQKGWIVASVNYRLGLHATPFYQMYAVCNTDVSEPCAYAADTAEILRANFRAMQDVKGAVRFMKTRSATDSTDPQNVFLVGESAGGFTVLAAAFMNVPDKKPAECFEIPDAPAPDSDMKKYGCSRDDDNRARPDLGSIRGTLYNDEYDESVKGVGNFYGGVFDTTIFEWSLSISPPVVYLFHQGSDVIVNYTQGRPLSRISQECFAPLNLCQSYSPTPMAYGSKYIYQLFQRSGIPTNTFHADIVENYAYNGNCFDNGHSIDSPVLRAGTLVEMFAKVVQASGNKPELVCNTGSSVQEINESTVRVFPNPAEDFFTLVVPAKFVGSRYRIVNVLGVEVMWGVIESTTQNVEVGGVAPGIHVITLSNYKSKVFVKI